MFRLAGVLYKNTRIMKDTVICDTTSSTRTQKIFRALDTISYEFDLEKPIWLDGNIEDFRKNSKTRFFQDNFIEDIPFDYLEVYVLEDD